MQKVDAILAAAEESFGSSVDSAEESVEVGDTDMPVVAKVCLINNYIWPSYDFML